MESLYGPRPGQRPRTRSSSPELELEPTPAPAPASLWRRAFRVVGLISLGTVCFAALVIFEADNTVPEDHLERLMRIQQALDAHAFDPVVFDSPAFTPLQTAILLPSSALRPAGADTTARPKRRRAAALVH